ncbi:MAG: MarC family protein [Verrucomicrobiia bacterium]
MRLALLTQYTLYLLVLINPISKIFILSVLSDQFPQSAMRKLILKSTVFAWAILLVLGIGGNLILSKVFQIEMHSLKTAAGIILFFVGYNALTKGVFFEIDEKQKHEDISLVPLASPMIAGPATITAAISLNTEHGFAVTASCITLAVLIQLCRHVALPMDEQLDDSLPVDGRAHSHYRPDRGCHLDSDGVRRHHGLVAFADDEMNEVCWRDCLGENHARLEKRATSAKTNTDSVASVFFCRLDGVVALLQHVVLFHQLVKVRTPGLFHLVGDRLHLVQ